MIDRDVRRRLGSSLGIVELAIYAVLGVLLAITALAALANAARLLWGAIGHWMGGLATPQVLNELLFVLMAVEILNTVRISIRSHTLLVEPFLVVGLIASIRRILVITLEATALTKNGAWATDGAPGVFRASMIELGLLGALVLVLVFAITLLRRYAPVSKEQHEP
jgi:uncharacterized membrane protein (DUF373 family)